MTRIDERDDTILYCLITLFSIATIAVCIYVVFGYFLFAYLSISLYALAFIAICLISIRKLFVIKNFKVRLTNYEENADKETLDEEFYAKKDRAEKLIKSSRTKELIKGILSGAFAVFTIIVLVLF